MIALALLLIPCTSMELAARNKIKGHVKHGVYTSPNESFRVRVPALLKPGARIKDGPTRDGGFMVLFEDDLCRGFVVSEHGESLFGGHTLEEYISHDVLDPVIATGGKLLDRKTVQLRHGTAVAVHYAAPAAGPCMQIDIADGKTTHTYPNAEIGMYVFQVKHSVYVLLYNIGQVPADFSFGPKRGPLQERLAEFVDSFELNPATASE